MHSLDALPVVVPHLHPLTKLHAKPNSKAIANSNVQNEGIPPALLEIWQQVREKYLQGVETIATERQDTHLGGRSESFSKAATKSQHMNKSEGG